jgi:hypothetical protein
VVSSARRVVCSARFCTLQRALPCPRLQAVGKGFWFCPFPSARFSAASRKGFSHRSRLSFLVAESGCAPSVWAHLRFAKVFRRADILVRHWAGWRRGGEGLEEPRCVIASEAKQSRIAWQ